MKAKFKSVDYFCATSDIWSRSNRSFIAVSVHYYDSQNLELKTAFIACEHFEGRHTNSRLADKLHSIFDRYGILDKVFFITTDGAGEYTAAFKYFGDNYRSIELLAMADDDLDWLENDDIVISTSTTSENPLAAAERDSDVYDSESECALDNFVRLDDADNNGCVNNNDSFVVHDLFEIASGSESSSSIESSSQLLRNINRIGCSSHLFDKLGKKDSLNALKDPVYAAMHNRVFEKLQKIWDQKNSRLSAEIFARITGRKIIGPHRIRWLKTYDAVSRLRFIQNIVTLETFLSNAINRCFFLFQGWKYSIHR